MPAIPRHPRESARLACLYSLRILDTAPEKCFDDIATLAANISGCPMALVSFVDECRLWHKAKVGITAREVPRNATFCAHTLLIEGGLIVRNAQKDARFANSPVVTGPPRLRFYAGVPIEVDGIPLGTVCVFDTVPHRFSPKRLDALRALGRQASALLQARLDMLRLEESERRFASFVEHAPAVAFLKDEAGCMRYINRRFAEVFNLPEGRVTGLLDREWLPAEVAETTMRNDAHVRETGETLSICETVPTADGVQREWSVLKFPVAVPEGIWVGGVAMDVTELNEARRMARLERDFSEAVVGTVGAIVCVMDRAGRFVRFNAECERQSGYRADEAIGRKFWEVLLPREEWSEARRRFAAVVLGGIPVQHEDTWMTKDGERRLVEWRSTILRGADGRSEFVVATGIDMTEVRVQQDVIEEQMCRIQDATVQLELQKLELEEANDRLQVLATTDALTGAMNRRAFQQRLDLEVQIAMHGGSPLTLAMIDVDRFKSINDDFGHQVGDAVLIGLVTALKSAIRETSVVARLGGEEFVVLMPGVASDEAFSEVERLRMAVEAYPWRERQVTASFGVATLAARSDAEDLIRAADTALYSSKSGGRNRTTLATPRVLAPVSNHDDVPEDRA